VNEAVVIQETCVVSNHVGAESRRDFVRRSLLITRVLSANRRNDPSSSGIWRHLGYSGGGIWPRRLQKFS
jgi:hypothetical protein